MGLLRAARKGDDEIAAQYLNTRLVGTAAAGLAHQLFVVLDRRLPARLNALSDRPEGSLTSLIRPDEDVVGTIRKNGGKLDIVVEKVIREKNASIWLFSGRTLDRIPDLFAEVNQDSIENLLPSFLVKSHVAQVILLEWLPVLLGMPLFYLLTGLVSRLVSPWIVRVHRRIRKKSNGPDPLFLAKPLRLLVMALLFRVMLSKITLPLSTRQLWSSIAGTIAIAACVWLMVLLNGRAETFLRTHMESITNTGAESVLRLGRRTVDVLIAFTGMLVVLHHFGVNLAAALAGLGVGGIAVALAAQKTLENVIGGISIIFDRVVRVGDMLNTGNTVGAVEDIGLRSTKIRTLNGTLVCVPNGQLANVQLENLSARNRFWFHHCISLHSETTAAIVRSAVDAIGKLLAQQLLIDPLSIRVHLLRLGTSSLDVEMYAYFSARDMPQFLEIQQGLLLQVIEIVGACGARMSALGTIQPVR